MQEERRETEYELVDNAAGAEEAVLDVSGRVVEHVRCRACGYDLITLHKGQQCPECGSAVAISLGGDLLINSRPDWTAHVGRHVRIAGLLLTAFPIILSAGVALAAITARPVYAILPAILLLPWCYCVRQATRLEPVRSDFTRQERVIRRSAGALALSILLALALVAVRAPLAGLAVLALGGVTFLIALASYLSWLADLVLRAPANDVCDTIQRRLWAVLGLTVLMVVMTLVLGGMGVIFVAAVVAPPAWIFYVVRLGYASVVAGEVILCESRLARQNWLEREALLDKEDRFRDPSNLPQTPTPGGIPVGS